MKKALLLSTSLSLCAPFVAVAADYGDGIHKNDYKWMQFNLMHAFNQKPGNSD